MIDMAGSVGFEDKLNKNNLIWSPEPKDIEEIREISAADVDDWDGASLQRTAYDSPDQARGKDLFNLETRGDNDLHNFPPLHLTSRQLKRLSR